MVKQILCAPPLDVISGICMSYKVDCAGGLGFRIGCGGARAWLALVVNSNWFGLVSTLFSGWSGIWFLSRTVLGRRSEPACGVDI